MKGPMTVGGGRCAGWWSLEILLTTALCVSLMSAGGIALYQVMGMGGGMYPRNQLQQVELSRLMLEIEGDFAASSRAYVWNKLVQESSPTLGPLKSLAHYATSPNGDYDNWNLGFLPTDDSNFFTSWVSNSAGIISATDSDTDLSGNSAKLYYTLVLLGGAPAAKTINAVITLTCAKTTTAGTPTITYTLVRYENDGTQLTESSRFTYSAPGVSFTSSDQSATTTVFPSITRSGSITGGIQFRFPTAFSTALRDIGTGDVARRVKYTADAWGVWTFAPLNNGRWN